MKKEFTPCIFIADDNPNNIKVLSAMLEAKGYDTRVALDGEQALSSIRQSKPDLILLDVHMPKMDGYQVCEVLKEDEELKDISVIFISALNETFNKIQGFKLGAVDYIEKPFQIEEVEIRIETQLKLRGYRQRLREKAKYSEERLKLAAEAGNIGVWEWKVATDTMLWDDRMLAIHGVEKHSFKETGSAWLEMLCEEDRDRVREETRRCLAESTVFETEFQIVKPDETIGFISARADVFPDEEGGGKRVVGVALDITNRVLLEENRRKIETKLFQAQKMEAVGTLASGVAHDFNNILSGIFGYSQLVENNNDKPEKVSKYIKQIHMGAQRASELVQQILTFSRKQKVIRKEVRVDLLIEEVLGLIKLSIPDNVEMEISLSSKSNVYADPTQIHQVIMNLCVNANHSMVETGGTLSIVLDDIDITEKMFFGTEELMPGRYVRFEVGDTGQGIEKSTLDRIFEPYFTTKDPGEGTGLGLAVVHGIVQEHKGLVEAFSQEGKGSLFKIYLPVLTK